MWGEEIMWEGGGQACGIMMGGAGIRCGEGEKRGGGGGSLAESNIPALSSLPWI